jgi:hypothetical protein
MSDERDHDKGDEDNTDNDVKDRRGIDAKYEKAYIKTYTSYSVCKDKNERLIHFGIMRDIYQNVLEDKIPLFNRKNGAGLVLGYACLDLKTKEIDPLKLNAVSAIGKTLDPTLSKVFPISKIDIIRYAYLWKNILSDREEKDE